MTGQTTTIPIRNNPPAKLSISLKRLTCIITGIFFAHFTFADKGLINQPLPKPATPFTAQINSIKPHTAIYELTFGGFDIGHIRYQLQALDKPNQFRYTVDSDLSFLLLFDKRQIISDFSLDNAHHKIIPVHFSQVRKGTGFGFKETMAFTPKDKKVTSTLKKTVKKMDVPENTLDPLNAQLQMRLDFLAGKSTFNYPYISSQKIDKIQFEPVSKEALMFDNYSFSTQKVEVSRKHKKRTTNIWFSKNLAYIPLKIEDSRKGKEAIIAKLIYYQEGNITLGHEVSLKTVHEYKARKKKKKHLRK